MAKTSRKTKRTRKTAKELFSSTTYFIPYRLIGEQREYINRFAQFPKDTKISTARTIGIPEGAWITDHGNGTRVVHFYTEQDALDFAQFFSFDIVGIETLAVATENQWA